MLSLHPLVFFIVSLSTLRVIVTTVQPPSHATTSNSVVYYFYKISAKLQLMGIESIPCLANSLGWEMQILV